MEVEDLFRKAHETAKIKGWWGSEEEMRKRNPLECIALIHTELSEAVEEFRKGSPPFVTPVNDDNIKPEGWLVELADAVIRIGDFVESEGLTNMFVEALKAKMDFNQLRPFRHGGKKY